MQDRHGTNVKQPRNIVSRRVTSADGEPINTLWELLAVRGNLTTVLKEATSRNWQERVWLWNWKMDWRHAHFSHPPAESLGDHYWSHICRSLTETDGLVTYTLQVFIFKVLLVNTVSKVLQCPSEMMVRLESRPLKQSKHSYLNFFFSFKSYLVLKYCFYHHYCPITKIYSHSKHGVAL